MRRTAEHEVPGQAVVFFPMRRCGKHDHGDLEQNAAPDTAITMTEAWTRSQRGRGPLQTCVTMTTPSRSEAVKPVMHHGADMRPTEFAFAANFTRGRSLPEFRPRPDK